MSRNDDFNGPEQDGVDGYQLTHLQPVLER